MVGTLAYVVVEAVRVILSGGSEVSPVSLAAYGGASAIVSILTALALRRMGKDLPLIEAEAAGWLSAAVSSALIFVGGLVVLLLRLTPARGFEPYADSVLVILGSLLLVPLPVMLLRKGLRELLGSVPDDAIQARVREAVGKVATAEGLPVPILRASKQGNTVSIEAAFVLPDESGDAGDVDAADRVRRGIRDGLADLPYDVWIIVEFTHDAGLVE
ncbi:hypothetical protein ET445_09450 [Agromyces protaetiae]|uniref:Cation efflux protein transmembrane domain-containing protein n=1 Tax=Agromyces protaetiae TaxID=2509455 RepID=A0A4P6FGF9_9MICO|nr:hypothetical protein ET445_09450 [Agromyces protaetiae]